MSHQSTADAGHPLIVIVGPTASGKSGLAVGIAHRLAAYGDQAEIINADSMQLYRGMDIGTAKATGDEQEGITHHLLDILNVTEEASVAQYQEQARQVITQVRQRGNIPVLVGGSGLYIRAVTDAIEFPPTDDALRQALKARLEEEGAAALREELRQRDPESAATVIDDRRLIRALEVVTLTGRTFTSFMPQRVYQTEMEPVVQLGLRMERALLHQRIADRVEQMHCSGLLEEVRRLDEAGIRHGKTASQAIGYSQYLRLLDGEITAEQAQDETIVATRKFARRQDTWFRADPRITWLDPMNATLIEQAMEVIRPQDG